MRAVKGEAMSHRRSIAALLVFVLVSCGVTAAHLATGTVRGSVQGAGNRPLAGVRVSIASSTDSTYDATMQTNAEGAFTFANAPLGEFEVKAYDGGDRLLAASKGILEKPDEVVTLLLQAVP